MSRLKVKSAKQFEAACTLMVFLDDMGFKQAWKARSRVVTRHGEYWEECDHCGDPAGEHDEPCHRYDPRHEPEYYEDR